MTTREQILQQAYLRGFEKGAQAAGMNRDALLEYLWNAENAARVGYDKTTGLWKPYDDNGHPAIGPGVHVKGSIPKQDTYTQAELDRYVQQSIDEHTVRARKQYPTFDKLHPQAQKALFDMEYKGIHAPNMYAAFKANDPAAALRENRTYVTIDGNRRENTRRDTLRRGFIDRWAASRGAAPAAPTPAPAPQTQQPATVPSVSDRTSYTVQPGETLGGIAKSRGVTPGYLQQYNPTITDPNRIRAGQNIVVPTP